jgi:hypothetical protein
MVEVLITSAMEITTEENTSLENQMDMECILGQMEVHIKGTLKEVSSMEKANGRKHQKLQEDQQMST